MGHGRTLEAGSEGIALRAQWRRMDSLRGQLLLAEPMLLDPNFQRTVVLVTEHTEAGAMGLVLNRPSGTTVGEAAPELEALADGEEPVFVGGPVQPGAVMVLAQFDDPTGAGALVTGDVGFLQVGADFTDASAATRRARVYAGYAGWGPGQLEAEIEAEGWIHAAARREDLFSDDPETLWSTVLDRKGGRYALIARMPLDPSVN